MSVDTMAAHEEGYCVGYRAGYAQALADIESHAQHRDPLAASNIRDAIMSARAEATARAEQVENREDALVPKTKSSA